MLEGILPRYDVREYHETTVAADADDVLEAALGMPAASDPLVAGLLWLRRVPGGRLPLRDFLRHLGFTLVVSTTRSFGAVAPSGATGVRLGFAVWVEPDANGRARLATETRVLAERPGARLRFRLYWLVVGPFSALIRRRWLAAAKRRAERGGRAKPSATI